MRVSVAQARRLALLLAAAGLFALYFGALRTGLLNDDQLFLEDAHRLGVSAGWSAHGTLANYFRPVSRGLFFGVLAPLTGGQPFALHLALFALLLVSLALLWDLLRAFATLPGAAAGTLYFALLPLVRVDLTWISCAQDLLALAAALGALAAFRRGRDRIALLLYLGAIFSKESALPLPALLAFWAWRMDGASPRAALGRTVPFAGGALAWALAEFAFRRASAGAQPLHLGAAAAPAALAHLVQAVLGLELSRGAVSAALASVPSLVALALLGAIAALLPAGADAPGAPAPHARGAVAFALLWLLAFTVPVVPVVWYWSAYFYTLAAVGGAVLVALVAARLTRWGFLACVLCGLWWHAASCALPEFSVGAGPWSPVSHWTPYYFERAARLARELEAAMKRATPTPARGTHFFLTTLPPWAGFQSGNGAALRALYRDPSLASYFYTQFSDSTAGAGPDEFLFWDGVEFERLYAHASDRWFQVGTDLLILDHPAGAVAAFRRALDAREPRLDVAYWLGWALLWTGERAGAERAWQAFGAHDDSTAYRPALAAAQAALAAHDTVGARRALLDAVRTGIGEPEPHARLGALLGARSTKFALLETKVAARLDPSDPWLQRSLFLALVEARLDETATAALAALRPRYSDWSADSEMVRAVTVLQDRSPGGANGVFGAPAPDAVARGGLP